MILLSPPFPLLKKERKKTPFLLFILMKSLYLKNKSERV